MIHWTPEGQAFRLGLNIYVSFSRAWLRLVWFWFDAPQHRASVRYFRLRLLQWPAVVLAHESFDVVENYLRVRNLRAVTYEVYIDFCKERIGYDPHDGKPIYKQIPCVLPIKGALA